MIHLDEARRAEGWIACMSAYGFNADAPNGWDVLAIVDGDNVIGGVLVKGPEAHIGVTRTTNIRHVLRKVIGDQIKAHGYATTSVRKTNTRGQRFVERIGYTKSREDEALIHYVLKELRYA